MDARAGGETTTGIDVRVVGSQVLVTSVERDSSAFAQGVRPGWEILKIARTELGPVVAKLNETYTGSTLRDLMLRRAILGRLEGAAGAAQVEFLDGDGKHVGKTLAQGRRRAIGCNSGISTRCRSGSIHRRWATETSVTWRSTSSWMPSG